MIVYMYLWDFFYLKRFLNYSLCSVYIFPPVCSSHSAFFLYPACILLSVCILPLVRIPQSVFYTDSVGKFVINAESKALNCIVALLCNAVHYCFTWLHSIVYLRHTSTKIIVTSSKVASIIEEVTGENDRQDKFDRSGPQSGWALSIYRPLFSTLDKSNFNQSTLITQTRKDFHFPDNFKSVKIG